MAGDDVLAAVELGLRADFGDRPARASVSFVGVEPIEVLRFEPRPGELVYASLGMARHPMTAASSGHVEVDGPRAELVVRVAERSGAYADAVWRRLAVLAAAPAVEGVVYVDGLTVDLGEPLGAGSIVTGGVVVTSGLAAITTPAGPVDVLEVLSATSNELAWARVRGGAALRERWDEAGTDLRDLARAGVALG